MSKMTAKAFVDKAVDIAKNYKTLYVMGCFGAPLTGSNVSRYCNNHSYNKNATRTAMIKAAAQKGWIDEERMVCETAVSIFRAGCEILLTYYAPELAKWIDEGRIG